MTIPFLVTGLALPLAGFANSPGVPPLVVGLTVVAFGTGTLELVRSATLSSTAALRRRYP